MTHWIRRHQKKIFRVTSAVLILFYSGYMFLSFAKIPIDADFASLVLEARDILSGNLLLNGWNLTGATYTFTELPFYSFGTLLFGVDIKAYIFATTLMYLLMFLFGFLLTRDESGPRPWLDWMILFAVAGFPGVYWSENLRAHTGVFVCAFAALLALKKMSDSQGAWPAALYVLAVVLGTMSDSFMLPIVVVPVLIFSLLNLLSNREAGRTLNRRLFFLTAAGIIAGLLLRKAYLSIGGANENSLSGVAPFSTLQEIPAQFLIYISALLKMFGCDFTGTKIFTFSTVWSFFRIWILFFGFSIIFRTLKQFFSGKNVDLINTILSLGVLTQSVFLILTPFMSKLHGGRYISCFPIIFAVLLIREARREQIFAFKIAGNRLPVRWVAAGICALLIAVSIRPVSFSRTVTGQDRLATFLREQNLLSGYADFATANMVTVASENRVKVRAISFEARDSIQQPYAYLWFSKTAWYSETADFVIISGTGFKEVNEKTVSELIGEPDRILTFETALIYVYDQDISAKIVL